MKEEEKESKLIISRYNGINGILIYCCACGKEMEETVDGNYKPIEYESEKHNRYCNQCRIA